MMTYPGGRPSTGMERSDHERRVGRAEERREEGRAHIFAVMEERGCATCGYSEDGRGLRLDHIVPRMEGGEPEVKSSPASWSEERRWWYLNHPNIQVLCSIHHDIKTHEERRRNGKPIRQH